MGLKGNYGSNYHKHEIAKVESVENIQTSHMGIRSCHFLGSGKHTPSHSDKLAWLDGMSVLPRNRRGGSVSWCQLLPFVSYSVTEPDVMLTMRQLLVQAPGTWFPCRPVLLRRSTRWFFRWFAGRRYH